MNNDICVLTGQEVITQSGVNNHHYTLIVLNKEVTVFVCDSCKSHFNKMPHHIFKSLILNEKFPRRAFLISDSCTNNDIPSNSEKIILNSYLSSINYPKNPKERLDSFFMYLFSIQKIDGEKYYINLNEPENWMRNYFVNQDECLFYIEGLIEKGLINFRQEGMSPYNGLMNITHKGLSYAIELVNSGEKSQNCFIAMAFDERTNIYREAIRKAITSTGFEFIIIDEQNIDSNKTIPDSILAAIKNSKFCVADFSYHRNGVYFESGYALGLGKQIIYTCLESEFENSHFDIKQLQHIIYKDEIDLEKKLIDKIEAWII